MSNLTPEELARIRADHTRAAADPDERHRMYLFSLLGRDDLPHLLTALDQMRTERDDAIKEGLRLTVSLEIAREDHARICGDYERDLKRMTERVHVLTMERVAWQHAAEQASGMHMAENILAERNAMKMKLRACEGERDALRIERETVMCDDANCPYYVSWDHPRRTGKKEADHPPTQKT